MWFYEQMLFIFGNFRLKYFLDNDSYMTKKRREKKEGRTKSFFANIEHTLHTCYFFMSRFNFNVIVMRNLPAFSDNMINSSIRLPVPPQVEFWFPCKTPMVSKRFSFLTCEQS